MTIISVEPEDYSQVDLVKMMAEGDAVEIGPIDGKFFQLQIVATRFDLPSKADLVKMLFAGDFKPFSEQDWHGWAGASHGAMLAEFGEYVICYDPAGEEGTSKFCLVGPGGEPWVWSDETEDWEGV